MSNPLRIGTVLLRTDTFVPESVWVQRETFCVEWQAIINLSGDELDKQIRQDGWNLMFMGGAISGISWGSWSGTAIRCAAIRVLKKTRASKFNAFEITDIHARRFLGVPCVVVTGHSRHLQQSTVLQNIAERIHQAAQIVPSSTSGKISAAPMSAPAVAK
jgi:hypothetical protein